MEVATEYIDKGYPIKLVLKHCNLARSSFYYKPKSGKQGRKPYAIMADENGVQIGSEIVLISMLKLFENPFVDYGYYKVYIYLRDELSYKVSKHLVYKLMKINNLLQDRYLQSSKKGKRTWAKDIIPQTEIPFNYFEFDIKFVWLAGKKKNMQVLTVLDINSRWNVGQFMAFSIKKEHVKRLFDEIFKTYSLPKNITVRSDNGSQFIATEVQNYFLKKNVDQEFIKPATPVMDAHIESYHSIMESAVCQRVEMKDLAHGKKTLAEFRQFYNFERIHGGIGYKSPYKYLLQKGIDMMPTPV